MGGGSWEFNVRGIYHGTRKNDDETQFWLRHEYLIEKAPPYWKGIVGWYTVRITNPDAAPAIAKMIDEEFSNSANETRTQTESAFAASMVKQMGNIEFLIMAIGSVVFFTLLLVTGNTMAISVRERTNELAVLKAIGYSDTFVLTIVLAESLLISAIGGAIGLWLASMLVDLDPTSGLLLLYLPPIAFVLGAMIALGTGRLAGMLPAWAARRLNVVSGLRRL
jgi:putative ABC transport system permease protein